jgi:DNA replication protein DnaC
VSVYTPEQAARINWSARWEKYQLPRRFWDLGLADMKRTRDNARALDMGYDLVQTWPQRRQLGDEMPEDRTQMGKGFIVIGPPATGKTRMVCAIATDIARTYSTEVLYMPVVSFFALGRKIQQETDIAVKLRDEESLAKVKKLTRLQELVTRVPLLIWDDQGKEYDSGSGWNGTEVYRIFRTRFDRCLPTLTTTNVPLPQWSEKYEGAMFSFLHEAFDAAAIGGEDWRRAGR